MKGRAESRLVDGMYSNVKQVWATLAETRKTAFSRCLPPLVLHNKMPLQRSILGSISGNRRFNCELTPYQRGKVVGLTLKGAKSTEVQTTLNISHTLSLDQLRNKGESQLRTGRPKSYIEVEERLMVHYIQINLKDLYA